MGLLRAGSLFRDFIPIIAGSIIINQSPPPFFFEYPPQAQPCSSNPEEKRAGTGTGT